MLIDRTRCEVLLVDQAVSGALVPRGNDVTARRRRFSGVSDKDLRDIADVLAKENDLIKRHDVDDILGLYTEDAIVLTGTESARGKEVIKRLYEYWYSVYDGWSLNRTTLEVVGMGDSIAQLGSYTCKVWPKGQEATEIKGKSVLLWKGTPEGWKIHWEVELEELKDP